MMFASLDSVHADISILPFRIEGVPDGKYFSGERAPRLLQEAAHFIFGIHKDYPLQSIPSTNEALRDAAFEADHLLSRKEASSICSRTKSDYILAGGAEFFSGERVKVSAIAFSCRYSDVAARSEASGNMARLQSLIAQAVREATPFARDLELPARTEDGGRINLGVIIDFSGSMASDLASIHASLSGVVSRLPEGSRMGAVLLQEGHNTFFPYSTNFMEILNGLRRTPPSGNVTYGQIDQALSLIDQKKPAGGVNKALIITDAEGGGRRPVRTETQLRRLAGHGVEIHLVSPSSQKLDDRLEWERLSRTLSLPDPFVVYARRIGFLEGYSILLIMRGPRFYRLGRDARSEIFANRVPADAIPIETIRFGGKILNLNDLPAEYAKSEKLRMAGADPVISGLEKKLTDEILSGAQNARASGRVLLKNGGRSFWISVSDRKIFNSLKDSKGKMYYVGLRLRSGGARAEGPENLPGSVYIRRAGDVPELMINSWDHILKVQNGLRDSDVWFFLSEILEVRDVDEIEEIR